MVIVYFTIFADVVVADNALISNSNDELAVVAFKAFDVIMNCNDLIAVDLQIHLFCERVL